MLYWVHTKTKAKQYLLDKALEKRFMKWALGLFYVNGSTNQTICVTNRVIAFYLGGLFTLRGLEAYSVECFAMHFMG